MQVHVRLLTVVAVLIAVIVLLPGTLQSSAAAAGASSKKPAGSTRRKIGASLTKRSNDAGEIELSVAPVHHLSAEIFQFSKWQDPLIALEAPTFGQRKHCAFDAAGKANSVKAGQKTVWTLWEGSYCQGKVIAKGVGQAKSIDRGGPVHFKSISLQFGSLESSGVQLSANGRSAKVKRGDVKPSKAKKAKKAK